MQTYPTGKVLLKWWKDVRSYTCTCDKTRVNIDVFALVEQRTLKKAKRKTTLKVRHMIVSSRVYITEKLKRLALIKFWSL